MQDHPLHAELTARFSGGLKWVECGFGLRGSTRTFAADLRQKAAALAQELLPLDDERLLHLVSCPAASSQPCMFTQRHLHHTPPGTQECMYVVYIPGSSCPMLQQVRSVATMLHQSVLGIYICIYICIYKGGRPFFYLC